MQGQATKTKARARWRSSPCSRWRGSPSAATLGLGFDKSYTIVISRRLDLSYFDHPPLHQWIAHFAALALGEGAATRLPFIALFAATGWLMFALTRRLFDPRAGLIALFALNLRRSSSSRPGLGGARRSVDLALAGAAPGAGRLFFDQPSRAPPGGCGCPPACGSALPACRNTALTPFEQMFPEIAENETRFIWALGRSQSDEPFMLSEHYCNDPSCHCNRLLISVIELRSAKRFASYRESYAFNLNDPDPGPFIDPSNPCTQTGRLLFPIIQQLLQHDSAYVERLKCHYRMVKDKVSAEAPAKAKIVKDPRISYRKMARLPQDEMR